MFILQERYLVLKCRSQIKKWKRCVVHAKGEGYGNLTMFGTTRENDDP